MRGGTRFSALYEPPQEAADPEETMAAPGAAQGLDTFPKLLLRNAQARGARPSIREKDLGIWQTWTWGQVLDEVRAFALGLQALGIRPGERIAIIGSNRPRLYWTFVTAQSLGAVPVPVYQDSVADEMAYVLGHAEAAFAVVEDQEQVDKVLSVAERLPTLRHIVYDEPRGLREYDHSRLHTFADVQAEGRAALGKDGRATERWESGIAAGRGEDLAVILYTSGTTGRPKGVMLSHANMIRTAENACAFDRLTETDEILSYLPLAWVGDNIFSYAEAYVSGFCISCPESRETFLQDLREIGPSFFFAPPPIFERLLTQVTIRMEDAGRLKKRMFRAFLDVANRTGEDILNGRPVGLRNRLLYGLGRVLVYEPLKNALGFTRVRVGYTAGEAIGPEIFRFYRSLGLNLKQLYGQTEASVFITMQPDGEIRADTVGRPAPEVEIRIADDGEVQFRSPGAFLGYYKDEAATAAVKLADGWVKTGDAGFFGQDGHLRIIDRAKDVGRLNSGALFAPKYIENKLKFFPNIKEAVAFGHGRDFVTAFVNIDLAAVGDWAERNNVVYGGYQDLAALPEVYDMVATHVDQVNRELAMEPHMAGSQIRRFLILHKELDADDGELTRTSKVRRGFIAERYAALVEALYDGSREKEIATEVTFEDGRKGLIHARVAIRDMPAHGEARRILEAAE